MADDRTYVVNETYRSSSNPADDEFQAWLNEPIDTGIRNSGGIRSIVNPQTGEREFLVFVTDSSPSRSQNPWEDIINMEDGRAKYWGDAKARHSPDPDAATGNGWVKSDYCRTYAQGNRNDAPPVLLFEKPATGQVIFRGLCIITDLRIKRHRDDGATVVNYLFDLAILDVDTVPLPWIHRKAKTGKDQGGPDAWERWVSEGVLDRYSIYTADIRTKNIQYPTGREADLLADLRNRITGPTKGKQLERLVRLMLQQLPGFIDIEITPPSGDRGVDVTGRVNLFSETAVGEVETHITFKSQVKHTTSSISGKELSRLASRIGDGEIGLFFTTSHYTKRAQEESLSTYPLRLFAAKDFVELLLQTELVEGATLTDKTIKNVTDEL